MHFLKATTADEAWKSAYKLLKSSGSEVMSRAGRTNELLHCQFVIERPVERIVFSREPALNISFAIAEIFWILSGRNDSHYINYWNSKLASFSGADSHYHGAYGHRLRCWQGFDQLKSAYSVLKNNPDSRQVVLQIWDSVSDFPFENGQAKSSDIPCNVIAMLKIREGRLHWQQVMRSNDLFLGTPHNFFQFTFLQEVLAGWLGCEVGSYHHLSDSLHTYNGMAFSDSTHEAPQNTDTVRLSYDEFTAQLKKIDQVMHSVSSNKLCKQDIHDINKLRLSPALNNLLLICLSEASRKRGWKSEQFQCLKECSNNSLLFAQQRWLKRLGCEMQL